MVAWACKNITTTSNFATGNRTTKEVLKSSWPRPQTAKTNFKPTNIWRTIVAYTPCLVFHVAFFVPVVLDLLTFWLKPKFIQVQLVSLATIMTAYIAITMAWLVEKQWISISIGSDWQLWPNFCSIAIFAFKKVIQYVSNLIQDMKVYLSNALLYQSIANVEIKSITVCCILQFSRVSVWDACC